VPRPGLARAQPAPQSDHDLHLRQFDLRPARTADHDDQPRRQRERLVRHRRLYNELYVLGKRPAEHVFREMVGWGSSAGWSRPTDNFQEPTHEKAYAAG